MTLPQVLAGIGRSARSRMPRSIRRRRTFRWVPVNTGKWAVSILWTFAPSPFIDERSPIPLVAALYVVAGSCGRHLRMLTAGVARSLFFPERDTSAHP